MIPSPFGAVNTIVVSCEVASGESGLRRSPHLRPRLGPGLVPSQPAFPLQAASITRLATCHLPLATNNCLSSIPSPFAAAESRISNLKSLTAALFPSPFGAVEQQGNGWMVRFRFGRTFQSPLHSGLSNNSITVKGKQIKVLSFNPLSIRGCRTTGPVRNYRGSA